MSIWTSPNFQLTAKDRARLAWLGPRTGGPLARAFAALLTVGIYGSQIVGAIAVIESLVQFGLTYIAGVWLYLVGATFIARLRLRMRARKVVTVEETRTGSLDEHGYITTLSGYQTRIAWSKIDQVIRTGAAIYLVQNRMMYHLIPRRCFADPAEMEQIYVQVRDFHAAAVAGHAETAYPAEWESIHPDRPADVAYRIEKGKQGDIGAKGMSQLLMSAFFCVIVGWFVVGWGGLSPWSPPALVVANYALGAYLASLALISLRAFYLRWRARRALVDSPTSIWLEPAALVTETICFLFVLFWFLVVL